MRVIALSDGIGLLEADGTITELDLAPGSLTSYLRSGGRVERLRDAPVKRRLPYEEGPLAAVAGAGSSVWGVGLNYRSKQVATGREIPDHPVLFVKGPGSVCSAREPIVLPHASECVDYEGEIAVVIGATLFEASPAAAGRAVAGFAAANDVTARDIMRWSGNPSLAKSSPGFGQLGSVMEVTAGWTDDVIGVQVQVNGELRQSDASDGMLIPVDELLALISRYTSLQPGDVVLTGTPAGTGDEEQRYLSPGDVVEVSVGELPPLRSQVVAAPPASQQ